MIKLVLATHNAHKVGELRSILGRRLDGIDLVSYDGPEPVEDGESFEANALIKARAAAEHTGLPAIADDSGISVDALDGEPGIFSARYAGTHNDHDNLALLIENLGDADDRTARFSCAAAFVAPSADSAAFEHIELGVWEGSILREPAGGGGFGYDPIFQPAGFTISAAELRPEQKNSLSHRSLAFSQLLPVVRAHLLQ
jgi:XTP/dITP diphosphohydrolase